ncbi:MAG: TRAP transporter small permease [Chloroflexi bacterium]|nr:TRAP transporter small permease [Chloroflexota bacterium]
MQQLGTQVARGVEEISFLAARLGGLAVFAMMILITVDVIWRYILGGSTLLAEEGGGFLLLIVAFLPAADLMRRSGHIIVDLGIRRVPDAAAGWVRLFTYLLGFAYVSVFLWQAFVFQNQLFTLGRRSPTILFPLYYVQPFMIFGLALLWLMLLVVIVRHVHALLWPSSPEEREAMIMRSKGILEPGIEQLHAE